MRLKNLLSAILLCTTIQMTFAQTVNLQVTITAVERTNYNDCPGCGNPDPTWKITAVDNGTGSILNGPVCFHYEDDGNTLEPQNYQIWNVTNSNASVFTLGLEGFEKNCSSGNVCTFESYNFFNCFPSVYGDSYDCQNPNISVVNFMDSAPCIVHNTISPWCGNYRFYYSFVWTYDYPPTIITQPAANTSLCDGVPTTLTVAAALDLYGWNTGQNYQWQVSTSTACPGTGWTNIAGANSSTYSPPTTGGTRLYRCEVTSNCTANFLSQTTISNCAVVTYNPLGQPGGDPVPPIISGICGSTVLPGSTHILNILTPPTVGAIIGATGYNWTASGGSPTTGSTSSFVWTAPINTGTYDINLTYLTSCPPNAIAPTCLVTVGSSDCNFAYVSPTGKDSTFAGGPDVPYKTIAYALTQLAGRTGMRLSVGTYNESVPLQIPSNLIIDGSFVITNGLWSKSNIDSTVIYCSGTQVISNSVAHRVGFVSNGASNWELQDVTVRTLDISSTTVNGEGYSNYGLLAYNNSANFKVIRTQIFAGAGANGTNGVTPGGVGGAGGGGTAGAAGAGNQNRCGGSGTGGGAGGGGNGGASGGAGGGYVGASGCNTVNCGSTGGVGDPGIGGNNGAGGTTSYSAGTRPATPAASPTYYTPGTQGASGSNGFGGGGGGGGGGAGIGTCCTCGCGGGDPNGGAGGAGGGGGLPGSGGWGGGGSFGIYASGAATTGTVTTSYVIPGAGGTGGAGANGQSGAGGGGGNAGFNHGGCDQGQGGNGGNGGNGGDGGRGEDGADGLAQAIVAVAGATVSGNSTQVPNNYVVTIQYNNAKACIYSEIDLTTSSGIWTFPPSLTIEDDIRNLPAAPPASSYNATSSPIVVYATTPDQDIDLFVNGIQYAAYLKIAPDNRIQPVLNLSAHTICLDGTITLRTTAASHWGLEQEYDWRIYQGASVNSPLYQSSLDSTTVNLTGYAPGQYIVRYRVREGCCGWSVAVFDTFDIAALPVQYTVQGGGDYCPGGSGVPIELSGSQPGILYVVYYNGVAVDSMVGTGASPLVFANETQIGTYTIQGFVFTGCGQPMIGYVNVGLSQTPTVFRVSGGGQACPNSATGPSITLNGSQLGVSYQLFLNGVTPEGNPIAGTGNQISFGGQGAPGTYTVIGTFVASPYCSSTMADSAVVSLVSLPTPYAVTGGGSYCIGDTGRQIGMAHTDTATTYSLYTGGLLVAGPLAGTGGPINFGTFTLGGVYNAIATNSVGCDTSMANTVRINPLTPPSIISLTSTDLVCYGSALDTISILATSSNGSISYSIDSGLSYPNSTGLFTGLAAGDYYVFVEDDSSCKSAYVVNPVVIAQPAAPLTVNAVVSNITCNGANNGSIELLPSGGWGAYTYNWSSTQTLQIISGLSAGTYTGSVTDIKGCVVSLTETIVNPTALSDVVSATAVTCAGASNGSATVTVSGGTPPYTYLWSNFSIDSTTTGLSGGVYYVIVTDSNGCQKRDSAAVAEGLPLVLSDSVGQTNCTGINNSSIHIGVSGGTGPYVYVWSPAGSTGADTTNIASGTYDVTVTDHNGCSATISVVVNNISALSISNIVTQPSCNGLNNGTISVIVTGGTTPYTYSWLGGISTGPNVTFVVAGTYSVTVTDAHGCSISDSIVVNQPTPMYVSGIQKNVSCHNYDDGEIWPTAYGGTLPYSYQWYLGQDTFAPQGPVTQNIIQLSGGYYYLIVTDANGCMVPFTRYIVNPDSLVITMIGTNATCQSANSGSVAVVDSGGTRPYQFLWNNFVTDSFQNNIPGGNYAVVVTDSNGCHQTGSIVINGQPSPMAVNTSLNNPTCNGGTNGFIALDVQGGAPPYSYNWNTTPAQNGSNATNLNAGTYIATVSDQAGCQVFDTASLVEPLPISVSLGGGALTTCISNADGYAVVNVTGGVPPYRYQIGNIVQNSDTFAHLGVGIYSILVTDVNGCQGNTTLTIASIGSLAVTLTANPNYVLAREPVQLEAVATSDTAIIAYFWSPLDSLNFSGCADTTQCDDPIATPSVSQVYTVTVENARGCTVTDTVSVTIAKEPSIFIPTAFTPNGDNLNDRFEFDILGAVSADVKIWNRWGEKVFDNPSQPNGINDTHGWDGTFHSKEVQYDSYTYQLVISYFDGHQQTIAGTVVVMR